MPAKSQAQLRFMFAAERRGELPTGTAKRWADHTPDIKGLPQHVGDRKPTAAKKVAPKRPAALSGVLAAEPADLAKTAAQSTQINAPSPSVLADYPDQPPAEAAAMAEITEGGLTQVMDRARLRFMNKLSSFTPFDLPNGRQLHPCSVPATKAAAVVPPAAPTAAPTVQQAQQQMNALMPRPAVPVAGSGPLLTTPQKAAPVPGMPGQVSTNVIDMRGGLDATGQIVDGNHGAGIAKGFKMAAHGPLRTPIHIRLARLRARRDPDGLEHDKPWNRPGPVKLAAGMPTVPRLTGPLGRKPLQEEEDEPVGLPTGTIGTLAGIGAAGTGLAYGMASDAQAGELQGALGRLRTPLQPHETAKTRYQDVFSSAAGLKPFGMPVSSLIVAGRTSPTIMNAMGQKERLTQGAGAVQEAKAHYDNYGRGPISAFSHDLRAMGSRYDRQADPVAAELHAGLTPHFDKAWRDYVAEQSGKGGLLENSKGWLEPHEIDQKLLPHDAQLGFMKRFMEGLPPEMQTKWKTYDDKLHGKATIRAGDTYGGIIRPALSLRDKLKTTGITAGGAAAGAGIGNLLYRMVAGRKAKRGLGYWASTLGGGALGGAAAYGLGTPGGQELVRGLLAKVRGKSAELVDPPALNIKIGFQIGHGFQSPGNPLDHTHQTLSTIDDQGEQLLKQLPGPAQATLPITTVSSLLGAMLAKSKDGPVLDAARGGAKGAMTGLGAAAGNYFAGEHGEPLERAGLMLGGGLAGNLVGTKLWDRLTGDDEDTDE